MLDPGSLKKKKKQITAIFFKRYFLTFKKNLKKCTMQIAYSTMSHSTSELKFKFTSAKNLDKLFFRKKKLFLFAIGH